MIRRLVLAAALAATVAPLPSQAEFDPECGRQGPRPIHAEFVQPKDGKLTVNSQVGSLSLTGAPLPNGVVLSTTGNITVEISHGCTMVLRLKVTKDGSPIHDEVIETSCAEQTTTRQVEIGLNGGEYEFSLSGFGCNGGPLVETTDGHYVGDPPLPL